jgi:acylphosphatase
MSDRSATPLGRLSVVVHGHVQGVGFRWFVRERARRLGLEGTVRNRDDGAVEVEASGVSTAVHALRALLLEGPPGARVERLDERTPTLQPLPSPFQIVR